MTPATGPDRFNNVRAFSSDATPGRAGIDDHLAAALADALGCPPAADPLDTLAARLSRRRTRLDGVRRWGLRLYVAATALGIGVLIAGGMPAIAECLP